ncbi:MAG TPA: hypothetical protein PKM63_02175 [Panacibacter sp.]|nr:hypothetical protein [Panacibacter sp.]HNP43064.1 hypothetical protein [Panacibacter sp.]
MQIIFIGQPLLLPSSPVASHASAAGIIFSNQEKQNAIKSWVQPPH